MIHSQTYVQGAIHRLGLLLYIRCLLYRSEGFALTGYDIPGCMEDGAWMPWENSSVVAAAVAAAVAHPDFGKWAVLEFYYGIGASGVRGSIHLVFRSTDARILRKVVVGQIQISKKSGKKDQKRVKRCLLYTSDAADDYACRSRWSPYH